MDPVSVIGLVASVVSIGDVLAKSIRKLSALRSQYHDAPFQINSLVGQLYILQAAVGQLSAYKLTLSAEAADKHPRYQDLALQIGTSLDSLCPLILALQKYLDAMDATATRTLSGRDRLTFLWNERDIATYMELVDRQVNALNLFLQAIQCATWNEQRQKVNSRDSQTVLHLARDCSSSCRAMSVDSLSFLSEDTHDISVRFDFDAEVIGSRVYQSTHRSHLKQAIRAASRGQREGGKGLSITADGNGMQELATIHKQKPEDTLLYSLEAASSLHVPSLTDACEDELDEDDDTSMLLLIQEPAVYNHDASATTRRPPACELAPVVASHPANRWSSSTSSERGRPRSNPTALEEASSTSSSSQPSPQKPWRNTIDMLLGSLRPRFPSRMSIQPATRPPIRMLLLGASMSGKSTILKAMAHHFGQKYNEQERQLFLESIYMNIVRSTKNVLGAMNDFSIPFENDRGLRHAITFYGYPDNLCSIPHEIQTAIKELWSDEGFQNAYQRRNEYFVNDGYRFYVENIDRLAAGECTVKDILYDQIKTTGITETTFPMDPLPLHVFDVGGARSERKKWVKCFGNTNSIVYTVDVTSWNRVLLEDKRDNRGVEDLILFESIATSRWFTHTHIILALTKLDLLDETLDIHDPHDYAFPDFHPRVPSESKTERRFKFLDFLESKFRELVPLEKREQVHVLRINAVDIEEYNPAADILRLMTEHISSLVS